MIDFKCCKNFHPGIIHCAQRSYEQQAGKDLSPFIPNEEGNKLVATESVDDPALITKAIYNNWYKDMVADI